MSDVIYPIGDGNDYVDKFFRPYGGYLAPIYALPGNHDWYDGLGGFMRHFASAEPLPPRPHGSGLKERIRDRLCAPSVIGETTLDDCRKLRPAETQQGQVPGPYWLIETEQLRFVGIDTGILGALDGDQGDWLKRISAGAKPKVLLTGKPIYVYNEHHPGKIYDRDFTVDEVVRDPTNNYIAALGGDIHNYQRYPVPVGDRTIQYIVSGGGGAFVHATHTIEKVSVAGVDEKDFRCYRCAQTRLHSTAAYTRGSSRSARAYSRSSRSRRLRWARCEMTPTREDAVRPTSAPRRSRERSWACCRRGRRSTSTSWNSRAGTSRRSSNTCCGLSLRRSGTDSLLRHDRLPRAGARAAGRGRRHCPARARLTRALTPSRRPSSGRRRSARRGRRGGRRSAPGGRPTRSGATGSSSPWLWRLVRDPPPTANDAARLERRPPWA
jgi:hypothetical protein